MRCTAGNQCEKRAMAQNHGRWGNNDNGADIDKDPADRRLRDGKRLVFMHHKQPAT